MAVSNATSSGGLFVFKRRILYTLDEAGTEPRREETRPPASSELTTPVNVRPDRSNERNLTAILARQGTQSTKGTITDRSPIGPARCDPSLLSPGDPDRSVTL
jgi:hypothetical protein